MRKYKATNFDGTEEVYENPLIEIHCQDQEALYNRCGNHPLFGPSQCPDCTLLGQGSFCGKFFVCRFIKVELEHIFVNGKLVKSIEKLDV